MLPKLLAKVNEHAFDLFVVFAVACIAVISYNLGHLRALQKSPVGVGENAAILDAASGTDPQVFMAGDGASDAPAAAARPTHTDQRVVVSKSSSSKKYHFSWCSGAKQIKPENQVWFDTATAAEAAGYTLAGNCTP